MHTIREIAQHFGSKAELARRLGCSPQAITSWAKYGIPASAAIEIERLTDGKFRAVNLPTSKAMKQQAA